MKLLKATVVISLLLVFLNPAPQSGAETVVHIKIKTVLASQETGKSDPRLRSFAQDLQSVFKYSSYQLLSQNQLNLKLNVSGSVSLPGNRVMKITPKAISGGRATLDLAIYVRKRQIFQTVIRLLNNNSVTVGGPKHRGGYLLFNIFTSF